ADFESAASAIPPPRPGGGLSHAWQRAGRDAARLERWTASDLELVLGIRPSTHGHGLAGHLARALAGPRPRPAHRDLGHVVPEQQLERPSQGHAEPAVPAR